ncbi:Hypothetical_protein [Hexamita inflata]|uniref:Hypothetical_protein n=1 Tax=Hexamita inflata TaxID=28002 RepID=A0AA86U8R6_9EUKA|nr:Hypothetical protein HINF_LOCUS35430 [Hexamita inflata]
MGTVNAQKCIIVVFHFDFLITNPKSFDWIIQSSEISKYGGSFELILELHITVIISNSLYSGNAIKQNTLSFVFTQYFRPSHYSHQSCIKLNMLTPIWQSRNSTMSSIYHIVQLVEACLGSILISDVIY